MKVLVITAIPSPYQVELFDELARLAAFDLSVVYLWRRQATRPWATPEFHHRASFADALSPGDLATSVARADLAIFSWYRHQAARRLMRLREREKSPWCFWGEAPGYSGLGLLGIAARRVLLGTLHASSAPIWGIGGWGVERYRAEFGTRRAYFNIPYFSDLRRFSRGSDRKTGGATTVLYSGALIKRKGVDVLARAWKSTAARRRGARLEVMGDGPLRSYMEATLAGVEGVVFHGAKGWAELPSYYERADILCAPSRYDGWGLVIPEALASAMPVVATTRMGAAREMVREGENGWRVEPGDETALAECLERALAMSAAQLGRLRDNARESAAAYDVTQGARRFAAAVAASVAACGSPR